jgi:aminopeptidase N
VKVPIRWAAAAAVTCTAIVLVAAPATAGISRHEVRVRLDLARRELHAVDRFTLAAPVPTDTLPPGFFLARMLAIESLTDRGRPVAIVDPDSTVPAPGSFGGAPLRFVRFASPRDFGGPATLELAVKGVIADLPTPPEKEHERAVSDSYGLIDTAGVFLSGASGWVPEVPGSLFSFRLAVELPPGYRSMSQGRATRSEGAPAIETWECETLQEEIYLVLGRYVVTEREQHGILTQTFLYAEDPTLAERYLTATGDYLALYAQLLGPYPYSKFALVENFWQTGFGMPSFTLLGDRVIRLPFIVSTSYGHEILHNWFGNSVYVDWEKGNWCEGLTSYLADHLYKEAEGQGADYRRGTLQAYRDFVRHANDFPLTAFRARHDPATQAVGYGKAMMTLHMLRLEIGDDAFLQGLRRLIAKKQFQRASWGDLRAAFEAVSGLDLSSYFAQWVGGTGAPALVLGDVKVTPMPDGFRLAAAIRQSTPPYSLRVPIAVRLQGEDTTRVATFSFDDTLATYTADFAREPVGIALDPAFDVWRRLDRAEIPASLGQAFGAESALVIVPSGEPKAMRDAYAEFATALTGATAGSVQVLDDAAVDSTALAGRAVWFLGVKNRLRPAIAPDLAAQAAQVGAAGAKGLTEVLVMPSARDPEQAWVVVNSTDPATLAPLGHKLPHYRKYGYLAFQGPEATNVAKAEWRVTTSPLARLLGGAVYDPPGTAPDPMAVRPAKPLAKLPPRS